jgi:hypothetical protein
LDLRAVSNGVKIKKRRKSRAASSGVRPTQKTLHETRFVLGRRFAKLLEKKVFSLVGAPGLDPLIKSYIFQKT